MHDLWEIYRTQFKTSLVTMAQYRVYLAIWIVSLIMEPIVYMTVWSVVTEEQGGSVAGFTKGDFAAYYLTWMLARHLAVTLGPDAIEWRIQQGEMSKFLVRPVHPIHVDIADNLGYKLVALPIILVMLLGLALVFPPTFHLQWWSIPAFMGAITLGFPIRFITHWAIGLVAFWVTRARALYQTLYMAEVFLTGRLAPLVLLPLWVQTLASFSPFRWMIAFPVEVLLGRLTWQQTLQGMAIQVLWLLLITLFLGAMWHFGIKRYGAVGA